MNKHTRLLVSVLFVVLIILTGAVTKFYLSSPEETSVHNNQAEIDRTVSSDSDGNTIFQNSVGLYGIADSRNRIIVAPEWKNISFANDSYCIASAEIGGETFTGCIDYEGNIVIPFIYDSIVKYNCHGVVIFCACTHDRGDYVIYDSDFVPMFRETWEDFSADDSDITLHSNLGEYVFSSDGENLLFKNASVHGVTLGCRYDINVSSRVLLSKLSPEMIEKISDYTAKYLRFAYTGNDDILSDITTGSRNSFQQLFTDDHKVLEKKMLGVSQIYLYSTKAEDGTEIFAVSIVTETEITYTDEMGKRQNLRDRYKAEMNFTGNSVSNLSAVSGKFLLSSPEYPAPEKENPEKPTEIQPSSEADIKRRT